MARYDPTWRLDLYESDGVTPLTPRAGGDHSDEFRIATRTGVTSYQPYMGIPFGLRGEIDPITRGLTTGEITVPLLDVRNVAGGPNDSRWFTTFLGDAVGRTPAWGKKVRIQRILNLGDSWTGSDWFTGKLYGGELRGRIWVSLTIRDFAEDLNTPIFVGKPHSSASNVTPTSLLPNGLIEGAGYGVFPTQPKLPGIFTSHATTGYGTDRGIQVSQAAMNTIDPAYDSLVITTALTTAISQLANERNDAVNRAVRIRCDITSGPQNGQTGDFYLARFIDADTINTLAGYIAAVPQSLSPLVVRLIAIGIGIKEVDPSDPDYLAIPADSTTCEFYLFGDELVTDQTPLMISDVHPVDHLGDLLDGYYGHLADDGSPERTIAKDAAQFGGSGLSGDDSFPTMRMIATKSEQLNDYAEEVILQARDLAYRINESGEVTPIDMRLASINPGSLTTLTNADLATSQSPSWNKAIDSAINEIHVSYFVDEQKTLGSPNADGLVQVVVDGRNVVWTEHSFRLSGLGSPDMEDTPLKIDGRSYRTTANEEVKDNLKRRHAVESELDALVSGFSSVFGDGVMYTSLQFRIGSNADALREGDPAILDIDELPDPATNLRGGPRLVRVLGREEEQTGLTYVLKFMDLGPNTVAVAPTVGTLALTAGNTAHSIDVPITVNAAGDRVEIWAAVTPSGTASRPADNDALWKYRRQTFQTGTVTMPNFPSGRRVWIRARSAPRFATAPKLPSGWVYPSGNDWIETTSVGTPGVISVDATRGNSVDLSWTNTESTFRIEVWIDDGVVPSFRYTTLPAGSVGITIYGLATSTSYTVKIRYIDPNAGVGPFRSVNFSTTATPDKGPATLGASVLIGTQG